MTAMLQRILRGPEPARALRRPAPQAPYRAPAPRHPHHLLSREAIEEYRSVARSIGVSEIGLTIEEFRIFLANNDLPIFNRQEVIAHMDKITGKNNPAGYGWEWRPVRDVDAQLLPYTFGTPSRLTEEMLKHAASDYFGNSAAVMARVEARTAALAMEASSVRQRKPIPEFLGPVAAAYDRILPLHALKKIALIEREFRRKIGFLVSDYVVTPHVVEKRIPLPPPPRVNPDPFLMAVVPNNDVPHGAGCFVIDVWDEPGFGLPQMLRVG
jgi:hypothetical protein